MAEARGDVAPAVRAAAAAARSLQTTDPARAVLLYERVLALRPNDREATDALAEALPRPPVAGRICSASCSRGSGARATDWRAARGAHLRVAELSFRRLRDSNAARADLQAAAEAGRPTIAASGSAWRRCASPPTTSPAASRRWSGWWRCWRRAATAWRKRARSCAWRTTTRSSVTTRRRCAPIATRWR